MTIIKRADLGRPLTWDELDDNFQQVDNLTAAASAAVSSASASATAAAASATASANSATNASSFAADASASATVAINALMNSTFEPSDFDFASGGTLDSTDRNKAVYNPADDNWYSWSGTLPKVVAAGEDPVADSNWRPRTDQLLRQNLASNDSGLGASLVGTSIDSKNTQEILDAPYVITGRVNIKNPRWNAPRDNAEDPTAAAANSTAINLMLASGAKNVELDDKARMVNSPLLYQNSVSIYGAGRSAVSLVWTGGDAPVFARPNYTDKDAAGFSNVRLQDLRITDQAATRTSYYTVDLFNGNSNGLERCWIDCPGRYDSSNNRIITADRYGVALGLARNSTLAGSSGFVSHMRDSRITNGTLMINGTDWYVTSSELWGSFRVRAVEISGGGTIDGGTQIVPGQEAGIFLFSDVGYDIDTLKLLGVYFDGSTDTTLFTGWGIKSAAGIGLVSAEILGCDFWHMNQGGILAAKLYSSTIQSNFRDCDSDDTGEDDIYCNDVYGSHIYNRHFRNTAPKNGDAVRVNLGKPYVITAKSGFPISSLGGEVSFTNAYARCSVTNPTFVNALGGSFLTTFPYGALPNASAMYGKTILVNGKSYYSDGSTWRDLTRDPIVLSTATDLHLLPYSHNYFASDITIHSNIPSGLTGSASIEYEWSSTGYSTLRLTSLKASGGIYVQIQSAGVWGAWAKTA